MSLDEKTLDAAMAKMNKEFASLKQREAEQAKAESELAQWEDRLNRKTQRLETKAGAVELRIIEAINLYTHIGVPHDKRTRVADNQLKLHFKENSAAILTLASMLK